MEWEKTIRYLNNEIHPHPNPKERDYLIFILENAFGYYTKHGDGLIRTESFDESHGSGK